MAATVMLLLVAGIAISAWLAVRAMRAESVVYLTPPMVKLCTRLAAEHPEGPLFLNSRGKPWTRNAIRCRFRTLRKRFPSGCRTRRCYPSGQR